MYAFIDAHRVAYGVEPICRVLQIAPSGYYRHRARTTDPTRRSARAQRDETLGGEIRRVHRDNHEVYGARKVWHQLRRDGTVVARCTVERLMRAVGLRGVVRGTGVRTTRPAESPATVSQDLVQRQFSAARPNQLWVAEVVCSQPTKLDVLALGARGEDVSDLDLRAGDDHAVDQQQDELAPLRRRRGGEPLRDPGTEGLERCRDARQLLLPRRVAAELGLVRRERVGALFQITAAALVFVE
jgi:hypothetical protein